MEFSKNAISWVEIPVTDFDRARKFYNAIFDYEMPEMAMGDDRLGILPYDMQDGGIGGAIVQGPTYKPSTDGARVYLNGGKDLTVVLDRVASAGGTIVAPKTAIGNDMGYFASFHDTEGNWISLYSMS